MCEPTKANAKKVLDRLERAYPDARIYLNFETPFQLLIATILAAQCTDAKVNQVTPELWRRYPTARAIAEADRQELEALLRPTGFFRQKTASVQAVCRAIVERYGGQVPETVEELTRLPGVGRKTANIVLSEALGKPAVAVDTHVRRVATRIGLARQKDPDKIEQELCAIIPRRRWTRATELLGTHGRRTCSARKPACSGCPVSGLCDSCGAA